MSDNVSQSLWQNGRDSIVADARKVRLHMKSLKKKTRSVEMLVGLRLNAADQRYGTCFSLLKQSYQASLNLDDKFRGIDHHIGAQFNANGDRSKAVTHRIDAQLRLVLAALAELKAQAKLTSMRFLATLGGRVADFEARRY